jgi:methionine aminopeptidase
MCRLIFLCITVDDAQTCLICETVIQYVETLVTENATVQEIDDALKKVCNFLPDTMKAQVCCTVSTVIE